MKAKASSQSKCTILVVKEEKYSCCFHSLHISLTHSAKNEGKGRINTLTTIWAYTCQSRSLLVFSLNPVLVNFVIFNFAHTVQRKCGGMVSKYFMVVESCILKWSLLWLQNKHNYYAILTFRIWNFIYWRPNKKCVMFKMWIMFCIFFVWKKKKKKKNKN